MNVAWKCIAGPGVETGLLEFIIKADERGSVLLVSHRGWAGGDELFMHCNSKWGYFLTVSLKNLLETGTGAPYSSDPSIYTEMEGEANLVASIGRWPKIGIFFTGV